AACGEHERAEARGRAAPGHLQEALAVDVVADQPLDEAALGRLAPARAVTRHTRHLAVIASERRGARSGSARGDLIWLSRSGRFLLFAAGPRTDHFER